MAPPDLLSLTCAQAARGIADGTVHPVTLIERLLEQIEAREPEVQAWATLDAEGARRRAAELARDAAAGRLHGPLHGVPLGIKDIYHVTGLPTRAGSRHYAVTPTEDATTVARLRAAGAIILGKTHTTEFALSDPAPTRNPRNPVHTPGGSSSGSAAAVAAAMVPAALGTQTAGSVLRPAAFCGVVGFKPTYGRISRHGILPLAWTLDHAGTLSRSVEDAALLLEVLAGADSRDLTCPNVPLDDYRAAIRQPTPPRLGFVEALYPDRLSAPARERLHEAADQLARAGAPVQRVGTPPELAAALDVHHVIMLAEAAAVHTARLRDHAPNYGPRLRAVVETGALIPAESYLRAQAARRTIRDAVLPLFERVDCLLVPAAAGPAPVGLESTGDPTFNTPWSLLGLPAIALPTGRDTDGLPLSVQLVSAPWQEARLLRAAAWCEGHLPA